MSFSKKDVEVLEDYTCTVSGSGISVTAATCVLAHDIWEKLLQ